MLSFVPVIICQLIVFNLPFCLPSNAFLFKVLLWKVESLGLKGIQGVESYVYPLSLWRSEPVCLRLRGTELAVE